MQNKHIISEEKSEFFWDINRQKYVMLMLDTQEIKVVEKEHIKRHFYMLNPSNWKFTKDTLFLEDNIIKSRYMTFEPLRDYEWVENGFTYRNTFIESKISIEAIKKRKEGLLSINEDMQFLSKYPHIKALLENLCNKQEYLEYFVNWLSTALATKQKIGTSVLFRGIQGTGKGVFWKYIIEYFVGLNYTLILENDTLKSNFTPKGLEKCLFVLANEIKADFSDGNSLYEKLKMYISDDILRIEEKGVQAFNSKNHFNMIFFSNNDVPLQIQGSDRRYSIFSTKSRTLTEVAKNDFGLTIDLFIKEIEKERDCFLVDLICFSYSFGKAKQCLETSEKERIYRASMTKIEIMADKVKNLERDFFENDLVEILEQMETLEKEDLMKKNGVLIFDNDDFKTMQNLIEEMRNYAVNHQSFLASHLTFIYNLFVDANATATKSGTALNSHFGQSYSTTINNKRLRLRAVEEFKQKEFLGKILPF